MDWNKTIQEMSKAQRSVRINVKDESVPTRIVVVQGDTTIVMTEREARLDYLAQVNEDNYIERERDDR